MTPPSHCAIVDIVVEHLLVILLFFRLLVGRHVLTLRSYIATSWIGVGLTPHNATYMVGLEGDHFKIQSFCTFN